MIATAVLAEGMPATYTGMRVAAGVVEEIVPYPLLPVPAHIGVTVFSPTAYDLFDNLFGATTRSDFEPVLFPVLVENKALYSFFVPSRSWIQVNDAKGWNTLVEKLKKSPGTREHRS
jgi:NDP-sugar pyrophosphorylase family protein